MITTPPPPTFDFPALVRRHHGTVRRYLARFLPELAVADELARTAFAQLYAALSGDEQLGQNESACEAQVLELARQLAIQHLRFQVQGKGGDRDDMQLIVARWQLARLEHDATLANHDELAEAVCRGVEELAPADRALLEAYYGGATAETLATVAGCAADELRLALLKSRNGMISHS